MNCNRCETVLPLQLGRADRAAEASRSRGIVMESRDYRDSHFRFCREIVSIKPCLISTPLGSLNAGSGSLDPDDSVEVGGQADDSSSRLLCRLLEVLLQGGHLSGAIDDDPFLVRNEDVRHDKYPVGIGQGTFIQSSGSEEMDAGHFVGC